MLIHKCTEIAAGFNDESMSVLFCRSGCLPFGMQLMLLQTRLCLFARGVTVMNFELILDTNLENEVPKFMCTEKQ